MDRRDALKYTAYIMGAAGLSAGAISTILAGCEVDTSDNWTPTFFDNDEIKFLEEFSETLLPKTETPGAKDAFVVRYLDTIRPFRYTEEENKGFKEELASFIELTQTEIGKKFIKASPQTQLEWLTAYDQKCFDQVKENPDLPEAEKPFYLSLKSLILGGYFSSEAVAKEYFAWDPIPGRYDACIPYEDVGRAWAL